jgi:hypothetical protein
MQTFLVEAVYLVISEQTALRVVSVVEQRPLSCSPRS